jgi:serine/threonine protein kinase/Tfp pilus assembly protein PilF
MSQVPERIYASNAGPPRAPGVSAVALDDPRVIRAVEEYLAALEAGPRPDRQQFLARHPDIAQALAGCLDGLEFVHGAAPQLSHPAPGRPPAPGADLQPEGPLGDFRIVREVGRGGMGVVYEAVQISLGRRVALKVLPFAAALDPRQLQRFKHEAQAAGQLHHTNIVPVYAVGCERGVHYYAMQFIDGPSLAQLIRALRQRAGREADPADPAGPLADELASGRWAPPRGNPGDPPPAEDAPAAPPSAAAAAPTVTQPAGGLSTEPSTRSPAFFRTVAQLGVQAALALEHAHQMGVLHRDVKPANLLLDPRSQLWVTDFGLARFHGEASLTLSGDLLGTLRYMSPEQALAQRGMVDQRSDVYSLGVTLYELLTLEPACRGGDRQEVLRQLERQEPRPPRQLNPAVPKDLETVVLKALAKEPAGRYGTAQELADDLRRFLEDRPVRARRPTLVQRATKWSRRHRTVVGAAALILLLAMVGLVVSNVLILREQTRAEAQRQRAEAQRQRAEANYRKARDAVDQMLAEVGHKWLANVPQMEPVRRKLLERALAFYEGFLEERGTDPALRQETGRAYRRVGDIRVLLGEHALAEGAYGAALEVLGGLVADRPAVPEYRHELAQSHNNLANLLQETGRLEAGAEAVRQSLALLEKLAAECPAEPTYRQDLATAHNNLGDLLQQTGRPEAGEEAVRQALALREKLAAEFPALPAYRWELAQSHNNLGNLLQQTGRVRAAEEALRRALALQEELAAAFPAVPSYRHELARSHNNLGHLQQQAGRPQAAEAAYHQAVALQQKLTAAFPAVPAYRRDLAISHTNLGNLLRDTSRPEAAEAAHRQALALHQKLAAAFPAVPAYRQDVARSHNNLGNLLRETGRPGAAEEAYRQALALREKSVAEFPAVPAYRQDLAQSHSNLGILLRETGRPEAAEAAYRQALALQGKLAAECPAVPAYRQELAHSHNNLGLLQRMTGRPDVAEAAYRRALALREKLAAEFPAAPACRRDLAQSHYNLGNLLRETGRLPAAEESYRRALALREKLAAQSPAVPEYRGEVAGTYHNLGILLQQTGRPEAAEAAFRRAWAVWGKLVAEFPAMPVYRQDLARSHNNLAVLLQQTGRHREAIAAFRQAVQVDPDHSGALNGLAWLLATCPAQELRDPRRAVALARRAVARAPREGNYWNTLGVAQYRAGDWPAAVAALEKSMQLRQGGDASDWFFLAMAHWQAGAKGKARPWYDRAVRWMEEHQSKDEELGRFRAEAATLLGLPGPPAPTKEVPPAK